MEQALTVMPETQMAIAKQTPQEIVDDAANKAKVLQGIVRQAKLSKSFGGQKEHLEYEAWLTIATFYNCTPVIEWTHPLKDKHGNNAGYEARANVVDSNGRIVGSAEHMCSRDEKNWKSRDEYAIRSMAQTRACSKAMRMVFSWVAVLAGYSATPAEEMASEFYSGGDKKTKGRVTPSKDKKSSPDTSQKGIEPSDDAMTEKQRKKLMAMMSSVGIKDNDMKKQFFDFVLDDGEKTRHWASQFIENFKSDLCVWMQSSMPDEAWDGLTDMYRIDDLDMDDEVFGQFVDDCLIEINKAK